MTRAFAALLSGTSFTPMYSPIEPMGGFPPGDPTLIQGGDFDQGDGGEGDFYVDPNGFEEPAADGTADDGGEYIDDNLDQLFDANGNPVQVQGFQRKPAIKVEPQNALADFWAPPKPQGNPPQQQQQQQQLTPEQQAQQNQSAEQQMAAEMTAQINAYGIPEEVIPADFNPSDPKQFRAVVAKIQQATIRQTMNTMMKPIQFALGAMQEQMRQEMAFNLNQQGASSEAERALLQNIPAAADPSIRPIVNQVFAQAQKRYPGNLKQQILSTRKMLQATGVRTGIPTRPTGRNNNQPRSNAAKSGEQALNLYAPLPQQAAQRASTRPQPNSTQRNLRLPNGNSNGFGG